MPGIPLLTTIPPQMEPLPVDIFQLQRRDPAAWTALLSRLPETDDVIVTAVAAEPLHNFSFIPPGRVIADPAHNIRRYVLTLADTSDPISFIAKQTNAVEAMVYELYGRPPATAMPTCHYVHHDGDDSYVILDDVPNHFPPAVWTPRQLDEVVATLARFHAAHWGRDSRRSVDWAATGPDFPHFHDRYDDELLPRMSERVSRFGSFPGREYLSDHALRAAGRLAPLFVQAAAGLAVMRKLNGWPGVLDESQMAAVADLLDDPVPMLSPLLSLPITLLHGAPHPCHWRLTLFDEQFLIDWSEVQEGPGILDLMALIEGYPLTYKRPIEDVNAIGDPYLCLRPFPAVLEETIVDTYLLTLTAELGGRIGARAFRDALPAARCLHVILTWFPFYATWATDLPDPYFWQHVNRLNDNELGRYRDAPTVGMRHYLAGVFERFLRAYRNL